MAPCLLFVTHATSVSGVIGCEQASDLDIALPDRTGDDEYLRWASPLNWRAKVKQEMSVVLDHAFSAMLSSNVTWPTHKSAVHANVIFSRKCTSHYVCASWMVQREGWCMRIPPAWPAAVPHTAADTLHGIAE